MRLSKTELKVMEQISKGNDNLIGIAEAINKDKSQVYRTVQKLNQKGVLRLEDGNLIPDSSTHISLLLQLLARYPAIIKPLSDCGIELFSLILTPKTIKEIAGQTGIKQSTVYYKLQSAKNMSFINIINGKYVFNEKVWPKAKEFLIELKKHDESSDKRIPPGAIIYFRNEKEIVFSSEKEVDAALTAFSAFGKFGIKILTSYSYYYLPKKSLSKHEVFSHALYVAEKEKSISNIICIALFYLKHKSELKNIKNDILDKIDVVLSGQKVADYPSLNEIEDRAEMYDIKL